MESFFQDLRFGLRTLFRNPAFSIVAVLTLTLGVGANAAIFSVVNAVLLKPLPWSDPDRVVTVWSSWTAFDKTWVSDGEVNDFRRESRTLAAIAAWDETAVNLTGDADPERVAAGLVTANLFPVLGVQPIRGRLFASQEDAPNGPRVAILGYGLWQRRYAGDAGIVGRSILIDGQSFQVVGVMPAGFVLPMIDGRAGARGIARDRAAMDRARSLSTTNAIRLRRRVARERRARIGAPRCLAAVWRGRIPPPDCLRVSQEIHLLH